MILLPCMFQYESNLRIGEMGAKKTRTNLIRHNRP